MSKICRTSIIHYPNYERYVKQTDKHFPIFETNEYKKLIGIIDVIVKSKYYYSGSDYYDKLATYFKNIHMSLCVHKYDIINDFLEFIINTLKVENLSQFEIGFIDRLIRSINLVSSHKTENNNNSKFNHQTILLFYVSEDFLIRDILKDEKYVDAEMLYDVITTVNVITSDSLLEHCLSKIKLNENHFSKFIELQIQPSKFNTYIDYFTAQNIYPNNEQIYSLITNGYVLSDDLKTELQIDDNDANIIISQIQSKSLNIKKQKSINYSETDKHKIKVAIFKNASLYTPMQIDEMMQKFSINYDQICIDTFCENNTNLKMYQHILSKGFNPLFGSLSVLIKKLRGTITIHKYF